MDLAKLINSTKYEHSRKVSLISGLMAEKAGYSQSEVQIISQAALYHDIGKSGIPKIILNKTSVLTPEEFDIVKTHTVIGCNQITHAIQVLTAAAIVAQQHHEHVNSDAGYHRLSGDAIHPYAKLVAVADVYDALRARRSYKEPWDAARIAEYFAAQSGKQFDRDMVNLLFRVLGDVQALYSEKH